MAPLHVCTVTFDLFPFEVRSLRQVEAAAATGHKVDVICPRQPQEKKYEEYHGIRIYRLSIGRSYDSSLFATIFQWCWFLLLVAIKLTQLQLKNRYDVVHVHNLPDFLVFAAMFPKLCGAKIILDVQDVSPELMAARVHGKKLLRRIVIRLATWQERLSVSFAHHIVTTGDPFMQILLKRGVPGEKITCMLNSADPRLFPAERSGALPFDMSDDASRPFIFMYHGTLAERNGLDKAIRALAIARQSIPQLRLDIQGSGDHLPYLKELAVELGVQDAVIFTGLCPADKLVDFVVHGDVGIIPYGNDGFEEYVLPTKAYEYAWMHRPIIASDTYAIRSMFRPASIYLCDPDSPESFAQAMIDLYQHPARRSQMIANAAEDYLPYRWELMEEVYQQLLATLGNQRSTPEPGQDEVLYPVGSSKV